MKHAAPLARSRLPIVCLALLLLLLNACASGPVKPRRLDLPKDQPVYIHAVKNLSGVPLARLDPDLYFVDNIEHLPMLAKGKTLSFPELLREAMAVVLRDEGFSISDDATTRLQIFLAVGDWSASKIRESGAIWLEVDGVLVDSLTPDQPLLDVRSKSSYQLLDGDPDAEGVLGSQRIITGAYNRIAIAAALDLLYKAGVIERLDVPPTQDEEKSP